jgi:sulfite exporter TauE/SafE
MPHIKPPRFIERVFRRGCDAAMRVPPIHRAAMVGMLTTLLPCGWLYSFALVAAGTANAADGALVLAAFWLGTLPVMVSLGAGVQTLAGPLRRAVPTVMALVIINLGLIALFHRTSISLAGLGPTARAATPSDETRDTSGLVLPAAAALDRVGQAPLPCCAEEATP